MKPLSAHTLLSALIAAVTLLSVVQADEPLDLGFAAPYAILAGSTITSTVIVGTVITGDIGLYPGTAITGFPPAIYYGQIDSANGASADAQDSLTNAYNVLASKDVDHNLSDLDLGDMTLLPGVYKFDAAAALNGRLTLDAAGDANAMWTFQIGSSLLIAGGSSVVFQDSIGNPDYVYWQVGSSATFGPASATIGNVVAFASITMNSDAEVHGRCLARNSAVTLDNSVVTRPSIEKKGSHGKGGNS